MAEGLPRRRLRRREDEEDEESGKAEGKKVKPINLNGIE